MFQKSGTPLVSFYNCSTKLVNFNENYTTVFFLTATMFYLLNYKNWGTLQERVYKTKINDIHELQERIADKWDKLDQHIIHKAVGQ